MRISRVCAVTGTLLLFTLSTLTGEQEGGRLADPFSSGWMLTDSNGDGVLDFVAEKVVVPAEPSAAENAVAADIAARLGFATTGLTPPVVVSSAEDRAGGPRIWVGVKAVPAQYATEARRFADQLAADEGGCSNWAAILPCSAAAMPVRRALLRGQKAVAKEALDAAVAAGRRSACKWMNVAGISSSGRTRNFA